MAKVKGEDIFVKVNTGTVESPVWTKVGGQKDASMSRGLEEMDVTDKDSAGWKERLPGNREIEVEFDGFLIEDNAGLLEMQKGFEERKTLMLQLITPAYIYQGSFLIGEDGIEGPLDDAGAYSFSLKSTGVVTKTAA
jgi:predicted secreted protein